MMILTTPWVRFYHPFHCTGGNWGSKLLRMGLRSCSDSWVELEQKPISHLPGSPLKLLILLCKCPFPMPFLSLLPTFVQVLAPLRDELTVHILLEAFLDNPIFTVFPVFPNFYLALLQPMSGFFFSHICKITKYSREERKSGRACESRVEFRREGKASPTEWGKARDQRMGKAGLLVWGAGDTGGKHWKNIGWIGREEGMGTNSSWKPILLKQTWHRHFICVLGPQVSALVIPHWCRFV